MTTVNRHKQIITGTACSGDGTFMRVVGTHTNDTKRGWFINNTSRTRGKGVGDV